MDFQRTYLDRLTQYFSLKPQRINLREAQKVCNSINLWVARKTSNRITAVINPEDLESRTKFTFNRNDPASVCVSAIYFRGMWNSKFSKELTQKSPFTLADGKTVDADIMWQVQEFKFAQDDQLKMLEMPFQKGKNDRPQFAMIFILPHEYGKLSETVNKIDLPYLKKLRKDAFIHRVDTRIPKFKMNKRYDLKAVLSDMGMSDAFNARKANFDGILHKKFDAYRIYIKRTYHDAIIMLDESRNHQ